MKNIQFVIEHAILDFQKDRGKNPSGIVLGPSEYRSLCIYLSQNKKYNKESTMKDVLVTEFLGYPLYVREINGFDLLISHEDAYHEGY